MVKFGLGLITGFLVGWWLGTHQLHLVPNPFADDDIATFCAVPSRCISWSNI